MIKEITLKTSGMTCTSCEDIISDALMKLEGISDVKANYADGATKITYDDTKVDLVKIRETIEASGYGFCDILKTCSSKSNNKSIIFNILLIISGVLVVSYIYFAYGGKTGDFSLDDNITLPALFLLGLITGVHCIGMCGSFILAYSTESYVRDNNLLHLKYGAGKLISYIVLGVIFGLLGSIISFTSGIRGVIGVIAGILLVIYGLNILNIFPFLRKLQLRLPANRIRSKEPFIIGLGNGLFLACGPLTAMYIYAAGTGSPINGAVSLFAFGLGTLPCMMIFGFSLNSITRYLHRIIRFSGLAVIILGLIMANNGMALLGQGLSYDVSQDVTKAQKAYLDGDMQVINMTVDEYGWKPDTFILRKGIKVKWKINVLVLTNCNNEIIVRDYGLDIKLKNGENIVEFTPVREGTVKWSCWMGMIPGTFIVK